MIIKSQIFNLKEEFTTDSGFTFPEITLSYQTYGKLNKNKDNAILVCHFFSGDKHIAGKYNESDHEVGWWDDIVGPGKPLDTDRFFIISSDVLSCVVNSEHVQSTSPHSINPETGTYYGLSYPVITIQDMVRAQKKLIEYLNIDKLYAVMGPSMGGIQALSWSYLFPENIKKCIPIACAAELDSFSMFFPLRMGIEAIMHDKHFNNGNYYNSEEKPIQGLKNAINGLALIARGRNWGHDILGGRKFSPHTDPYKNINDLFYCEKNIIEGVSLRADMYDPNCYIYVSKANILFSAYKDFDNIDDFFKRLKAEFLMITEINDIFIKPTDSRNFFDNLIRNNIKADYFEFSSPVGHLGSVSHSLLFAEKLKTFLNS